MSKKEDFLQQLKTLSNSLVWLSSIILFIGIFILVMALNPDIKLFKSSPEITEADVEKDTIVNINSNDIKDGIHTETGFVAGDGLDEVIGNCTNCHSAKLVTQNRMSRDGWLATIRWMQETQNLWDLGDQEDIILDYLATYYAPEDKGRRENLIVEEWYELK
ncbi:monoheme cytochrome C [Galbibacter sp. PAP.153]|uniref:monoheme cytochrome C n=1 Tax=Galbibacter sp. PAP.153 TaxID=3104623 RepID=UPI00300B6F30